MERELDFDRKEKVMLLKKRGKGGDSLFMPLGR